MTQLSRTFRLAGVLALALALLALGAGADHFFSSQFTTPTPIYVTQISTGYWENYDPNGGYKIVTGITATGAEHLKISTKVHGAKSTLDPVSTLGSQVGVTSFIEAKPDAVISVVYHLTGTTSISGRNVEVPPLDVTIPLRAPDPPRYWVTPRLTVVGYTKDLQAGANGTCTWNMSWDRGQLPGTDFAVEWSMPHGAIFTQRETQATVTLSKGQDSSTFLTVRPWGGFSTTPDVSRSPEWWTSYEFSCH